MRGFFMDLIKEYFIDWAYDKALIWMNDSQKLVAKCPTLIKIGVGSHKEIIITRGKDESRGKIDLQALSAWPHVIIRDTERGGGLTAHEPGQLVLYPVINLKAWRLCAHELVTCAEEAMISFMDSLGLKGQRSVLGPGIYLGDAKVGFIGMRIKEGISSHGFSLNLANKAKIFSAFEPCGHASLSVVSLAKYCVLENELGYYAEILAEKFIEALKKRLVS